MLTQPIGVYSLNRSDCIKKRLHEGIYNRQTAFCSSLFQFVCRNKSIHQESIGKKFPTDFC